MLNIDRFLYETLKAHVGSDVKVKSIETWEGNQGYSGAEISYYDVTYTQKGESGVVRLAVKDAPLVERRTLAWLGAQGVAVPFSYTDDLTTDGEALVCMQFVGDVFRAANRKRVTAEMLAEVHAANLGRGAEMDWLPRADGAYFRDWIIQACWRDGWQSLMGGRGFVDGYGRNLGQPEPGADFSAEFETFTERLEEAAEKMQTAVEQLWEAGDSLTLIHADLHDDHVYFDGERPYIIDWGQARYGPFYLDLPNIFSREEALLYREALERLGHAIPEEKFLVSYDVVRPYPGFKYFGVGLWNWCFGERPHQREHVLHFIDMILG